MRQLEVDRPLDDWWRAHEADVDAALAEDGWVVLDGEGLAETATFRDLAERSCGPLSQDNPEHAHIGDDPTGTVNTPVEFSRTRKLLWHNENTFAQHWPRRIAFGCRLAAERGETPTVDMAAVHTHLEPDIRQRFEQRGVTYIRRLGGDLGLDWRTVYGTEDRSVVEDACARADVEWEWDGDVLTTRQRRVAVVGLPGGARSFVAQVLHWHPRALDEDVRESMAMLMAPEEFPKRCEFGDGSPIPDADIDCLMRVCAELEESVPWVGDRVMVVDNLRRSHARNPYEGDRLLLVAMGRTVHHVEAGHGG